MVEVGGVTRRRKGNRAAIAQLDAGCRQLPFAGTLAQSRSREKYPCYVLHCSWSTRRPDGGMPFGSTDKESNLSVSPESDGLLDGEI